LEAVEEDPLKFGVPNPPRFSGFDSLPKIEKTFTAICFLGSVAPYVLYHTSSFYGILDW
jgi:hypothetical protein